MNKPAVIGILWAASLALAWFLGTNSEGQSSPRQGRSTHPESEPKAARAVADEEHDKDAPTRKPAPKSEPEEGEPAPADEKFTTEGAQTLDELSKRFMKYFEQSLRKGEKGHLELYRTFDQITQDRSLRKFFRSEAQLARLAYPWLKFVMKHDREMLAMTETIYKTAAENPSWFEGTDDDTLEIFVEGLGTILPGAVDEATMARFRGYVEKILGHAKDSLPKAMQKRLRDFTRNLDAWAKPLTVEESLARLTDPSVAPAIKLEMLRRIDKKHLVGIDMVSILQPAVEQGLSNVMNVVGRVELSSGDIAVLDQTLLDAVAKGHYSNFWYISYWLQSTRRQKWVEARPFVESGLRRGDKATEQFAMALGWLRERPSVEYMQGVLDSYTLSKGTVKILKDRFGIE